MSFFDKAKAAAQKAVHDHDDKIRTATEKTGKVIDEKTGGKHHDKIHKGTQKLHETLDNVKRKGDGTR
ncbi:antitoxin [Nocardioides sp. WL0053]|jgi:hypothetical protein|uniref:Antitoxin n=1 Tax=Nocardioides jiangsuensis TaxID=2866161 RepID=A0ABS7RLG6_9ACTN|nr:antitoxin [Nocardioides jiangsuensis]MBY9075904.1 antitoxin [Nocardioides jiangsuensis]